MEEFFNIIVNNGLGVASFIVLCYFIYRLIEFIFKYMKESNEVLISIRDTLVLMQENLKDLTQRVETLERKEEKQTERLQQMQNNYLGRGEIL